jgi:catechol-2,3-dioxygenase
MEYGQLHHVEYYVNDLAKTKEFWGWFLAKLGYSEYQNWKSGISYAHKNKTYLVFVEVESQHRDFINNRQAAGLNHIAFKGGSPQDLKILIEELKQKNIKILSQREDAICFEDPNEFAVEVFC